MAACDRGRGRGGGPSEHAIDLSHVFWMVPRPLVPAWAWFGTPVAAVAVLALTLRRQRLGGLAAVAGILGGALIAQLLLLVAAKLSIDHRAVLREHTWIGWPLVFPLIGALSGFAAVAISHLLRGPLKIALDHPKPVILRAGAGAVGLLSGVVM